MKAEGFNRGLNSSGNLQIVPFLSLPHSTYKPTGLYMNIIFLPHDRPLATCTLYISSEPSYTTAFQYSEAVLLVASILWSLSSGWVLVFPPLMEGYEYGA